MKAEHENTRSLWLQPLLVWLALLILLCLTVGSAYVPLGAFNNVINLSIAALKAVLVFIFFMHLARSSALLRLAAIAGLFWLSFMFSLTFSDYLTRPWNGGATSLSQGNSRSGGPERGSHPSSRLPLDEQHRR
jgi:cytochrome c oxidase subunit 4